MIEKANLAAKPIIISTEVLETMIKSPKPNRVEVTDIANTVLDGADCMMLDDETANGDYVVESIQKIGQVCLEAEKSMNYKRSFSMIKQYSRKVDSNESIAQTLCSAVFESKDISLIIAISESGKLARLVSKYKPDVSILSLTSDNCVYR